MWKAVDRVKTVERGKRNGEMLRKGGNNVCEGSSVDRGMWKCLEG